MNRDRRMNVLRRTAGLLLAAVTAFGGSEAAAEGTPSEVTMHEDKVIEYGDMGGRTVVRSLTDGSGETGFAYCTNPLDPNPPSGSVSTEPIEIISGDYSPADAAKVLYYGYGGPGFDASLFPDEAYYGGNWTNDKYFVCTHVMVSYVALGRKETATAGAWDLREPFFYQYILQDTLGRILAKPAPPSDFHAFMLTYGSDYQILYGFTYAENGKIRIEKRSSNPSMTDGNSCYSLSGAQYGVYESKADADSNKNAVEVLTTDGSGNAESGDLKANTRYYVKEIKASKGFELDPKVYTADVESGDTVTVSSKEIPDYDSVFLTLTKITTDGTTENVKSLEGAEFTVHYQEGNRTWVFRTLEKDGTYRIRFTDKAYYAGGDSLYTMDGNIVFPLGTYELQETEAPEGYTLKGSYINDADGKTIAKDGEKAVFKVEKDGNHGTVRAGQKYTKSEKPVFGGFRFAKRDIETGDRAQGDTDLAGSFQVFNRNDYSVIVNGKEYAPDEMVLEFRTDKDGNYETAEDFMSYGTYEIKEKDAPRGYHLNEESVFFDITEDHEIEETDPIENDVMTGKFSLTKALADEEDSEWADPEEGIEFAAVLKRYADQYGSVEEAIKHKDEFTEKEYAVVRTDKKGNAVSGELAYGTYLIKQTTKTAEAGAVGDAAEFVVDENTENTTIHYNPVNKPMKYYLRLIKEDSETNAKIVFNSASFKIRNKDTGEYVTMQVGSKKYDTFKTVSDHAADTKLPKKTFYAEEEESGTVVTPLQVTAGTYLIEEAETPWGFVKLTKPVEVTVASSSISAVEEGKNYKDVEIKNDRAYGILKIQKTIEEYEADTSLIDRQDLSGVAFTLTAAEDIIDPVTGSVLCEAGKPFGTYHPDKDGSLEVKNIPLGKYTLQETEVPDGLIRNEKIYDIVFEQKDQETPEYPVSLEIENKSTKVEITKQDVTGDGELEGASLVVKDSAGETVDEWVSGTNPHSIEGLKAGEEYTLTETIAPEGYAKATTINFKVNEDGSVTPVRMIDKVVSFKKSDGLGNEVPGAHVTVTDEDGNVIDDFVSTEEDHIIKGVEVGKTYTFHEEGAPDGYYYSEDAKVTITDDGLDQCVEMIDNAIGYRIFKTDDDGKPVSGVQLKLTDTTSEKVIREWTTDEKPAEFVKELIAGHQYLLEEEEWVNGVHSAAAMTFTVPMKGTADFTIVNMFDALNEITVLKTDNHGVPCPGADMQIIEKETGEVVYEFTSTDDPKGTDISKYVKGDVTYILRESEAPFGFDAFYDLEFKAEGTKEKKQIIVVNNMRKQYYVNVIKADAQDPSKHLKGAEITLYTSDGSVAKDINGKDCVRTTDDRGTAVFCVEFNSKEGYYAKETKAPQGYRLNKETYPVVLSESYDFAAENPIVITINDEALPKIVRVVTSDQGIALFLSLLSVSLAAAALILKIKKETKKE